MRSLPRHAEAPPLASMPHRATPEPSTLTALDDQTLLGLLLGRCLAGSDVDLIGGEIDREHGGQRVDVDLEAIVDCGGFAGKGIVDIDDFELTVE